MTVPIYGKRPARRTPGASNIQRAEQAQKKDSAPNRPKRTVYLYEDEKGRRLFRSVRTEPGRDGKSKSFHQECWRDDGAIINRLLDHVRRVPFHLPQLLGGIASGETVYVVEGEKDVETLEDFYGVVATTNPMGAGKWLDEYAQYFKGAVEVVVIADNDSKHPDPGARWRGYLHGETVRDSIAKVVGPERVRFKMPAGGLKDVTDHYDADHGLDELVDAYPPESARPNGKAITYPSVKGASPTALGPGPWPRLDSAAMYGLAGKVVEEVEPYTEADPVGMLTSFLTLFGALVGPGPHVVVEGATHPRLFTVHTGETARSRKGTNYKIMKLVFRDNEYWHDDFEFVGLATGEGLVKDLMSATPPSGKISKSNRPDKRRLIVETEFARVLSVASRDGNTLSALLRQAWDGDTLAVKTRKGPLSAPGASISMLGQITSEELQRKLTDVEMANGFANRYLYVCLRSSKELPEGGNLPGNLRYELQQDINEAIERARSLGNVVLKRTDAARERWAELYHEYRESPHKGLLGAVTRRAEAQSLRLSIAYAIVDGSDRIELAHVEAAHALWQYCEASAAHIFGGSTGNADADRIWQALGEAEGEQLSRTEVSALFGRNVSASRIGEAIEWLEDLGLVHTWLEATGGRPKEMLGKT